jgi:protein arginine N-methyltransferase 7
LKSTSANTLKESLAQVAGNPLRMVRLAHMLVAVKQEPAKARELCTQALALAPDDPEVATLAAEVLCADIPTWHFSLVRDTARNAAYDAALRRAVRPGSRVLDIGAGARGHHGQKAGAAHVVTCEANPVVAERTAAIVAHNGFADRIKVIAKNSNALEIGVDLDEPVDILVSEIIADNLLGEYVLPTMERAVPRLLKPGATIIPARGALRMALAQDCKTSRHRIVNMDVTDGFDLSPFNTLAPYAYPLWVGDKHLALRGQPADLFAFDFRTGGPYPPGRGKITLTADGPANGVVQWIALDLDGVTQHENRPTPGDWSSWSTWFFPFPAQGQIGAGDSVTVSGSHDRINVRTWFER